MRLTICAACALLASVANAQSPPTMASVMESASPSDWRTPLQSNLLYMRLDGELVIFELAPGFAPRTIDNLRLLLGERFFDGLAIVRSQENYVVQWGDPQAGEPGARSYGDAAASIEPEFFRARAGLDIESLQANDAYAEAVGFVSGFPVAADEGRAWLAHCYGMLGVGRATAADSGNAAELLRCDRSFPEAPRSQCRPDRSRAIRHATPVDIAARNRAARILRISSRAHGHRVNTYRGYAGRR